MARYAKDYLTDYEQTEIINFEKVYYLSFRDNKNNPSKSERLLNNGFDDNDGYYKIVGGD